MLGIFNTLVVFLSLVAVVLIALIVMRMFNILVGFLAFLGVVFVSLVLWLLLLFDVRDLSW